MSDDVLISVEGGVGRIRLNRPKAIHALTTAMCEAMSEALLVMTRAGYGIVGVADENAYLLGVVTDGDLRRHMDGLLSLTAGEVMTRNPASTSPEDLAVEALALMNGKKITCLMVTDADARVLGVLHIHDCLRAGPG